MVSEAARTTPDAPTGSWEHRLTELLGELSEVQSDLLALLEEKRQLLVARDQDALAAMQPREEGLLERLAECQRRRQRLLDAAAAEGLPSRDLRQLAGALPADERQRMRPAIRDAQQRTRLVQHQSLANWVLVQRSLLHLSQMVEIIATGGRKAPTYEKSGPSAVGGALVDRAV